MAEIQFFYNDWYCDLGDQLYEGSCVDGMYVDCKNYKPSDHRLCSSCIHAKCRRVMECRTIKNFKTAYFPNNDLMEVYIDDKTYLCDKVIVNGIVVFDSMEAD